MESVEQQQQTIENLSNKIASLNNESQQLKILNEQIKKEKQEQQQRGDKYKNLHEQACQRAEQVHKEFLQVVAKFKRSEKQRLKSCVKNTQLDNRVRLLEDTLAEVKESMAEQREERKKAQLLIGKYQQALLTMIPKQQERPNANTPCDETKEQSVIVPNAKLPEIELLSEPRSQNMTGVIN